MANKNCTGKKVSQEKSIHSKLKEMVKTDAKVYFLLWKYAPELLQRKCSSFEELKGNYKYFESDTCTEAFCNNWLVEKNMQTASKFLISRTKHLKLVNLYNKLYETALQGDVQAIKAFGEFSTKFFKENDGESGVLALLQGANIPEDDFDEDDEEFDFEH